MKRQEYYNDIREINIRKIKINNDQKLFTHSFPSNKIPTNAKEY